MKKFNYRVITVGLSFIVLIIALSAIKFYYFDIYQMSLNGRVKVIRTDIKQAMYITIANKEYNLAHFWPVLQANIGVGDSLYKKSGQYDITLIKWKTGKKLICQYEDYSAPRYSK